MRQGRNHSRIHFRNIIALITKPVPEHTTYQHLVLPLVEHPGPRKSYTTQNSCILPKHIITHSSSNCCDNSPHTMRVLLVALTVASAVVCRPFVVHGADYANWERAKRTAMEPATLTDSSAAGSNKRPRLTQVLTMQSRADSVSMPPPSIKEVRFARSPELLIDDQTSQRLGPSRRGTPFALHSTDERAETDALIHPQPTLFRSQRASPATMATEYRSPLAVRPIVDVSAGETRTAGVSV